MPIELLELLHNLSDRDWEYNPTYKIDKNEADKITYAITQLKLKLLSLEHFSGRNKGRWIQTDKDTLTYHCSICGFYNSHTNSIKYCEQCGARMESD